MIYVARMVVSNAKRAAELRVIEGEAVFATALGAIGVGGVPKVFYLTLRHGTRSMDPAGNGKWQTAAISPSERQEGCLAA